ncbi:MAG: lytic murein transglycosylase, partial [Caulobacteraceae bacterium]|nr:lytic murein transglycosylase [Caulobacteraceae bacterium]
TIRSGGDTPPTPAVDPVQARFDAWMGDFQIRAIAGGWPADLVTGQLAGLTPNPRVMALDNQQPEFSRPFGDYMRASVTDDRAALGRRKSAEVAQLPDIARQYGPPGEILTAIWSQESAFGTFQGDLDVIRSLATLAAEGRRRDWAETQLFAALRMIQDGDVARDRMRGSWAGAMGQTQFIPEAYLSTAVDGDGDGKRDIWNSSADALASAANLLAKGGWRRGEIWAREVTLAPPFDLFLAEGPRQTPGEWAAIGAARADGLPWNEADQASKAELIVPAGATGPAFLLFPNHFVIRKYNNSTAYALAVGLLADRIAGAGPLTVAWPRGEPLSIADRVGAQKSLIALGYDPGTPDGVIGVNTRQALRAWQKVKAMPADGYLTPALSSRLQAEAALLDPQPAAPVAASVPPPATTAPPPPATPH